MFCSFQIFTYLYLKMKMGDIDKIQFLQWLLWLLSQSCFVLHRHPVFSVLQVVILTFQSQQFINLNREGFTSHSYFIRSYRIPGKVVLNLGFLFSLIVPEALFKDGNFEEVATLRTKCCSDKTHQFQFSNLKTVFSVLRCNEWIRRTGALLGTEVGTQLIPDRN